MKQSFLHVDILGPRVHEGHFDLIGSDGGKLSPQTWERLLQPGDQITMHMWPMPEKPPDFGQVSSRQDNL